MPFIVTLTSEAGEPLIPVTITLRVGSLTLVDVIDVVPDEDVGVEFGSVDDLVDEVPDGVIDDVPELGVDVEVDDGVDVVTFEGGVVLVDIGGGVALTVVVATGGGL
jgi:hypothetical protein